MIYNKKISYRELLNYGVDELEKAGIAEAKLDAGYLLEFCSGLNKAEYFLRSEEEVESRIKTEFLKLIERRGERVPLSYITATRGFMGFDFFVNENVLIPEQDTEALVEEVIKYCKGKKVLDLCTGSGCIALSLALLGNIAEVTASDISDEALEVAKINFDRLKSDNMSEVKFVKSNLLENISGKYDIIVSNPPYIKTSVIESLEPEVSVYEPRLALVGGKDGLDFYRKITSDAGEYLNPGGRIFFETGFDQADEVSELLRDRGFYEIRVIKDLTGFDRVVAAKH